MLYYGLKYYNYIMGDVTPKKKINSIVNSRKTQNKYIITIRKRHQQKFNGKQYENCTNSSQWGTSIFITKRKTKQTKIDFVQHDRF